jgi:hypothetical protein
VENCLYKKTQIFNPFSKRYDWLLAIGVIVKDNGFNATAIIIQNGVTVFKVVVVVGGGGGSAVALCCVWFIEILVSTLV